MFTYTWILPKIIGCCSWEEIQSTYWSQSQAAIHSAVAYFKKNGMVHHQLLFSFQTNLGMMPNLFMHFFTSLYQNYKVSFNHHNIYNTVLTHQLYNTATKQSLRWSHVIQSTSGYLPCVMIWRWAMARVHVISLVAQQNEKLIWQ